MRLLALFIPIVVIDRILKFITFKDFPAGHSFPIIKGILHITPTYNEGMAFGLFKEVNPFVFIAISSITVIYVLRILFFKKPRSPLLYWGLALILSGAFGNLIDRIVYGGVLDFIDIRVWPVFNIADSSITIGSCLIFWSLFRIRKDVAK